MLNSHENNFARKNMKHSLSHIDIIHNNTSFPWSLAALEANKYEQLRGFALDALFHTFPVVYLGLNQGTTSAPSNWALWRIFWHDQLVW